MADAYNVAEAEVDGRSNRLAKSALDYAECCGELRDWPILGLISTGVRLAVLRQARKKEPRACRRIYGRNALGSQCNLRFFPCLAFTERRSNRVGRRPACAYCTVGLGLP